MASLPPRARSIVGREQELALARQRLARADVRLLSLTGPPGVGKTRLAIELAAELAAGFADGAWFVDLAPTAGPRAAGRAHRAVPAAGAAAAAGERRRRRGRGRRRRHPARRLAPVAAGGRRARPAAAPADAARRPALELSPPAAG